MTRIHIPAAYTYEPGITASELRAGVADTRRTIVIPAGQSLPNHEALVSVAHQWLGHWAKNSDADAPSFVWSDHEDIQRVLSEYYDCPAGLPADYTDRYWRLVGGRDLAPGVPGGIGDPTGYITNSGRSMWANTLGGGSTGCTGSVTGASSSTLSCSTSTSVGSGQFVGYRIAASLASGGMTWGNIVSHTTGTTPTFTVDQWYAVPDTGAAAATPSASGVFLVASGGATAAWYMGLNLVAQAMPSSASAAATLTALPAENTTANGMQRKISTFSLTSGVYPGGSYTIQAVYTLTASGLLTFNGMGAFTGNLPAATVPMLFATPFAATFSVQNPNDQATVTDDVSGS